MSFLKELIEFVFRPLNHLISISPKLDENTLHIKASSWEWTAIFCLNWLTRSTGSVRPLYMAKVGWWNRLGSFAFSIPRVKGDLEIWLNAFFITSVPTPLWEGLLRFLRWRCSSSQKKDSLCGVLDLCLYTVSPYLFYVQAQGNHLVNEHLRTLLDVDLILPYCPLYFTDTQVLPTNSANCRVTIWSLNPKGMRSWPSEPNTINL